VRVVQPARLVTRQVDDLARPFPQSLQHW
jgi:hypothetical protein